MSVLQPKQLAMFMTPAEVGELHAGDYRQPGGVYPKMKDTYGQVRKNADKYWEPVEGKPLVNHVDSLTKKVEASGGIERPIEIAHLSTSQFTPVLINGHHRATVAHETNRLVPAVHV